MKSIFLTRLVSGLLFFVAGSLQSAAPDEIIRLWPDQAPGQQDSNLEAERVIEGRPRPFYQITNVTTPTLAVFRSAAPMGTGILLCPGGGLQRLAIEHEGQEMAEALSARGFTVFLLKHRVPAPIETATMDAQRAMGLIRSGAATWKIDPQGIGFLGFSAGGQIGAYLVTHFERRLYAPVDDADAVSCRPDFAGLIYPGGLLDRRTGALRKAISRNLGPGVPPTFLVHAFDDFSQNSLEMAGALKRAGVPTELHLYQEGVHGFGPRGSGHPISRWLDRWVEWLESPGFTDPLAVRQYARGLHEAVFTGARLPRLEAVLPETTVDQAYTIQKHYVREGLKSGKVGGFKGAGASAAAQKSMGISGPLTGVMFQEGRLDYSGGVRTVGREGDRFIVETEIGYVFGTSIGFEVVTDQQMKEAVEAIMPVIELPNDLSPQIESISLPENVSANIGSERFMVGPAKAPSDVDPNQLPIRLTVDDRLLHETNGGIANGGQWHNLRKIVNQLVAQGYTIPKGAVVISGALGGVHKAVEGHYVADFSDLGRMEFRVTP